MKMGAVCMKKIVHKMRTKKAKDKPREGTFGEGWVMGHEEG